MKSVVLLNAGWDFEKRTVEFQKVFSDWEKARQALVNIQNDQNNVYNYVELREMTIDSNMLLIEEIWKLHYGQFYRHSVYYNVTHDVPVSITEHLLVGSPLAVKMHNATLKDAES
jgi:hypothetical protein